MGLEEATGAILTLFVAVILVWAFYPVLAQLAGFWYGVLFLVLALFVIVGGATKALQ